MRQAVRVVTLDGDHLDQCFVSLYDCKLDVVTFSVHALLVSTVVVFLRKLVDHLRVQG